MTKQCTPVTFTRGLRNILLNTVSEIKSVFVAHKLPKRELAWASLAILATLGVARLNTLWLLNATMDNVLLDIPLQLFGLAFYAGLIYGVYAWVATVVRSTQKALHAPRSVLGFLVPLVMFTFGLMFAFVVALLSFAATTQTIKTHPTLQLQTLNVLLENFAMGLAYTLAGCFVIMFTLVIIAAFVSAVRSVCEAGQNS